MVQNVTDWEDVDLSYSWMTPDLIPSSLVLFFWISLWTIEHALEKLALLNIFLAPKLSQEAALVQLFAREKIWSTWRQSHATDISLHESIWMCSFLSFCGFTSLHTPMLCGVRVWQSSKHTAKQISLHLKSETWIYIQEHAGWYNTAVFWMKNSAQNWW